MKMIKGQEAYSYNNLILMTHFA